MEHNNIICSNYEELRKTDLGLESIAGNRSEEVRVELLVREDHRGTEVAHLGHPEYPAQSGDLQRHLAGLGSDQTEDVLDGIVGADHLLVHLLHLPVDEALQEVHHLLGGVERAVAGVQHDDAQLDVGQQRLVSVDLVQSEEESLQWLHPVLVLDPSTGQPALPLLVYGHCHI